MNKVGLSNAACVSCLLAPPGPDARSLSSLQIYQHLGFTITELSADATEATLFPPKTTSSISHERRKPVRLQLLRAWVELGAWLQDYRKRFREFQGMCDV